MVRFALKTAGEGSAKVTVTAEGGSRKTSETIDIQVVNPNPETVTIRQAKLAAGESVSFDADGNSTISLAGFPAVDAAGLFRTMKNYPYSCSEQLSAKGLTMLHLLPQLSEADSQEARELIPGIIHQLYARQRSDGGFSYWSGGNVSDTWASSMAGQFLSEAAAAGFEVQKDVLTNWQRFQNNLSQAYRLAGNAVFSQLDECYRLYTLAVAGAPANAAMNRLKESGKLEGRADWMLAAAYAVSGKVKTAQEIVAKGSASTGEYGGADFTYGSSLRDKAVVLQVLALSESSPFPTTSRRPSRPPLKSPSTSTRVTTPRRKRPLLPWPWTVSMRRSAPSPSRPRSAVRTSCRRNPSTHSRFPAASR